MGSVCGVVSFERVLAGAGTKFDISVPGLAVLLLHEHAKGNESRYVFDQA